MILNITSFPRSGNSFFTTSLLQYSYDWQPINSDRYIRFRPTGRIYDSQGINKGVYKVEVSPWHDKPVTPGHEDHNPVRYIEDQDSVYVYKRHDIPDDYVGPRIYLVRDGRDVLASYAYHHLANRMMQARIDGLIDEPDFDEITPDMMNEEADRINQDPNVQWGACVERGLDNPNVKAVVKYEMMKADSCATTTTALFQCGYRVRKIVEPLSFKQLHAYCPFFYRRGVVGGYHEIHPDIIRDFEKRNEHTLKRLRYL